MKETKYAQIINYSCRQKGNVPKMYLTTTIKEGSFGSVTEYKLINLDGDKILQLYGKVDSDGHILHKIWHEIEGCFEKGFSILSHNEILDMHNRNNNHGTTTMNVYDYYGHIIYNEEIATKGNLDVDFRATVDDKFVGQKVAEFTALLGEKRR